MQLRGKKVAVLGLGVSGVSAVRTCLKNGATVVAYDTRALEQLSAEAQDLPISVHQSLDDAAFENVELLVVSPGLAVGSEVRKHQQRGAELVGELELGASLLDCPICAIGGTNGKSTTTGLTAEIAKAAGMKVFCGGNLGIPLTRAVGESWDLAVVEVSSFQLEHAPHFAPKVSVLLNLTEDHLDRHGTFEQYANCKGNAFLNQGVTDVAIGLSGDAQVDEQMARGNGTLVHFGSTGDYVVSPGGVTERSTGEFYALAGSRLVGTHNLLNAAAAIAAVRAVGISASAIREGLRRYQPLPHRRALVESVRGVRFYDDSKATNVGAAAAAVRGLEEETFVLIAGGKDKGGSYEELANALGTRARAVVLLGEAAPLMEKAFRERWPVVRARSMEEAVRIASELSMPGDAVLLSPACASFDMFRSYADRGNQFAEQVRGLKSGLGGPSEG